ncbi:hypothetical protein [Nocardia sp. NPDC052112]|uniref:TRADD-N-associated membrane domain-containing protein n=1 Tax=Nocardia sp. NPDC052112 TaxID=3155646 RepID=UPI00341A7134
MLDERQVSPRLANVATAGDLAIALRLECRRRGLSVSEVALRAQLSAFMVESILIGAYIPRSKRSYLAVLRAIGVDDVRSWERAWRRVRYNTIRVQQQQVLITGDNANINVVNPSRGSAQPELEVRRQTFFYEFLRQALSQAENTFRISMIFMSAGAVILLIGAALALTNAGKQDGNHTPIVTSLGGVLIATCGGAFTIHANRARNHLTKQADLIYQNMQSDHTLKQALQLIDQVEDKDLRDRLKCITIVRVLGMNEEPINVTSHFLSNQIEPSGESESN